MPGIRNLRKRKGAWKSEIGTVDSCPGYELGTYGLTQRTRAGGWLFSTWGITGRIGRTGNSRKVSSPNHALASRRSHRFGKVGNVGRSQPRNRFHLWAHV